MMLRLMVHWNIFNLQKDWQWFYKEDDCFFFTVFGIRDGLKNKLFHKLNKI